MSNQRIETPLGLGEDNPSRLIGGELLSVNFYISLQSTHSHHISRKR